MLSDTIDLKYRAINDARTCYPIVERMENLSPRGWTILFVFAGNWLRLRLVGVETISEGRFRKWLPNLFGERDLGRLRVH